MTWERVNNGSNKCCFIKSVIITSESNIIKPLFISELQELQLILSFIALDSLEYIIKIHVENMQININKALASIKTLSNF